MMVTGADIADAVLLGLVARGDSGALARLYEAHSGRLFGYLLRLAGDRMTAEEILQDTMLAVWRSAGTRPVRTPGGRQPTT
jgi:RNA polymerase sigma-70 factor (ECF subfamily)